MINLENKYKTKHKIQAQNINERWDTMKIANLRVIRIKKGQEIWIKDIENIFKKITEENFPNINKIKRHTEEQIDNSRKESALGT